MTTEERVAAEAGVADLEALLAQQSAYRREPAGWPAKDKDSHTSSKSPSSDRLRCKTKNLRKPSGKKAGGHLRYRGETLRLQA